jgi:serine/threonine-protein kinase
MGVVYRARQKHPDRIVALKVISAELAEDPQFRTRFQTEATIAAQIEHPNVIPVYAVGEVDGLLFIAMRFVEGMDLRAVLAEEGRLEPERAASMIDQVAQALDVAHAHGLVHRDVKPANILVASSGAREHIYLSDFGVTRRIAGTSTGLTSTGAFIGTIDYVAPEQARGERVDARADIYSLGCVLFHCLTGTVPFPADNELAKLYAHGSQPVPSVLERKPDLPVELDAVVARAMSKQPENRYQSAGDLGRAAVAASSGRTVSLAERTVAVGAAAPQAADLDPAGSDTVMRAGGTTTRRSDAPRKVPVTRRRKLILLATTVAALAAAAVVVAALAGGSGTPAVSTLSLTPVASQNIAPIPNRRPLQTVSLKARAGYEYQLALDTENAPRGSAPQTQLPLYLTLKARRGSQPFVTVQRLKLPSKWRWTKSSLIAAFTLDPNPDGSGQVALSWFVIAGDKNDVTHYLTVAPQGIFID